MQLGGVTAIMHTMTKRRRRPAGNQNTAIAYIRVSTDDQHLGTEAQRASIEAWAARQGVTVVEYHVDQGVSGGAALEARPALLAALASVVEHKAGYLVVARRDRLARDVVLAAMIDRLVQRDGARIVSTAGEATDNDDPSSILMRRIIDAFSEYERLIIRARTKAALGAKKARGERTGSIAYGYDLADDGKTLTPNKAEQRVVQLVRELHSEGLSTRKIVAELASRGIVSRVGKPLRQTQVIRILHADR